MGGRQTWLAPYFLYLFARERFRESLHDTLHLRQDNIKKLDASLAQQRTLGSDLGREKSRLQAEADSLRERMEALQGERDTFATQAEDFRDGAGSIVTLKNGTLGCVSKRSLQLR